MYPLANRKNQFVSPPRAWVSSPTGNSPTGPAGQEAVVPISTGASGYINLQVLLQPTYQSADSRYQEQQGVTGNFITIYADGLDIGIICGITASAVSSGNAPSLSAYGSVGPTGVYQGATGACHRIPAGQERRYLVMEGQDNFLGWVAATTPSGPTGAMRIYQSNPPLT